jgi:hypothetical protein
VFGKLTDCGCVLGVTQIVFIAAVGVANAVAVGVGVTIG